MRLPPISRQADHHQSQTTLISFLKQERRNSAPYRKTFSKTCKISPHPGHLTLSKPNNYFYIPYRYVLNNTICMIKFF